MRKYAILVLVALLNLLVNLTMAGDAWHRAEIILESDDQIDNQVSKKLKRLMIYTQMF